jgi:hypothetical protein
MCEMTVRAISKPDPSNRGNHFSYDVSDQFGRADFEVRAKQAGQPGEVLCLDA